jgi:hypothetical protein
MESFSTFNLKEYFKLSRLLQMNLSEDELVSEEMRIRTELMLRDIKKFARGTADEEINSEAEYCFSAEEIEKIKTIAKRYDISLYDAMALIFFEALLLGKKDEYKEKYPDKTVVDIYDYLMYYDDYVDNEEIIVLTLYDIKRLTNILFV